MYRYQLKLEKLKKEKEAFARFEIYMTLFLLDLGIELSN